VGKADPIYTLALIIYDPKPSCFLATDQLEKIAVRVGQKDGKRELRPKHYRTSAKLRFSCSSSSCPPTPEKLQPTNEIKQINFEAD